MKRMSLVLVAVLGLVIAVPSAASAHSTDDWFYDTNSPGGYGYRYSGDARSTAGGVYQEVDEWTTSVEYSAIQAYVEDTATDGYCATIEIAYTHGGWQSDHWHFRTVPVLDCSTNGAGTAKAYFYSSYPIGNLNSRACHANSAGKIIHCEKNWHTVMP
ncbi:hypothetical protein [Micromonospora sp. MW-13]|uniref:hypothetical protein n=1 Tax=Micromonospora sp. MW-13 TaxID=2094022 RepID=UPI000FFF2D97|nr:hypothetical protein [Micromonospora sp. MW-13]